MTSQNWDWIFIALGWTLAGLGVLLALWALFWDRSRGRRRCPKCWYSMEGAAQAKDGGLTCPECGKEIKVASHLCKTRRRWRVVALAGLLIWGATVSYRFNWPGREGVMAAVPTTALVLFVSDYTARDAVTRSLLERLWREPIAPWDKWFGLRREAATMPEDWSAAVKHRSKWPVGVPVRIEIDAPLWLYSMFTGRNTTMWLKGDAENVASVYHLPPQVMCGFGSSSPPDWLDLPAPTLGENRYKFVIESRAEGKLLAQREVEIVIEGVPTIEEVIQPFTGTVMPLKSMLQWSVWPAGWEEDWTLVVGVDDWFAFYSESYSTNYTVTLKANGQTIATDHSGDFISSPIFRLVLENKGLADVVDFENDILFLDGLTVEVTPHLEGAIRDLRFDAYWPGGFEVPLRSLPYAGHDGLDTVLFLIQANAIPLDLLSTQATQTEWLSKNAVKQSVPK